MQLQSFVSEANVAEALRLFQVSTLDAATSESFTGTWAFSLPPPLHDEFMYQPSKYLRDRLLLIGAEGFCSPEDLELMTRIEKQLKRRFPIGSQISETTIVQDFLKQVRTRWLVSVLTSFEIVN